jgi:hypothetical protein
VTGRLGGAPGRPPKPAYPAPPVNLRQLAIASADQIWPVTRALVPGIRPRSSAAHGPAPGTNKPGGLSYASA